MARADWHCVRALLTSAPALSSVCWNDSFDSSCCALAIFTRARLALALKIGCRSDPAAFQISLPGLTMPAPLLLVQPTVPLSVIEG